MAKFCGTCGSPLNGTAIFCGGCGTRVPAAAPAVFPPAAVTPSQPAGFAPMPAAFTPAPEVPAVPAGFAPVSSSFPPAPITAADPTGFAPVSASSFTPSPMSGPDPAGFAPLPAAFAPAPVDTPDAAGFAPVSSAFPPMPVTQPDPAGFAPLPPAFTPAPVPPPDPAGFAPVAPAFTPAPAAVAQASYGSITAAPPTPANYAPVAGASAPPSPPYAQAPAGYAGPPAAFAPAQPSYAPGSAYPTVKKSNTLLKVVVAVVVLIFAGSALALAGLWYAAQQIKAKAHAVTAQVLGGAAPSSKGGLGGLLGGSSTETESAGGFKGDPCRFLSKDEVSQAVGVQVIRVEAENGGCSYIAKGDPADMTAKHMSSMLGGMGADAQSQKIIQKFAGGMFAQQEATDKSLSAEAAKGEIPVLVLAFTAGNAALEMKMNRGAFEHIKKSAPFGAGNATASNSGSGDMTGIGDEAYVAGGSMIMLRKGNTMARVMYTSCPCNTDNVIPLARTLASRL